VRKKAQDVKGLCVIAAILLLGSMWVCACATELLLVNGKEIYPKGNYPWPGIVSPENDWTDNRYPANWSVAPNDYLHGKWHMRIEIVDYPSLSRSFKWCQCVWGDVTRNASGGWTYFTESCGMYSPVVSGKKTVTLEGTPSTWWNKRDDDHVDWTNIYSWHKIGLAIWAVRPDGSTCFTSRDCTEESANFFPMKLKVWIVAVTAGSTFSGWDAILAGGVATETRHAPEIQSQASRLVAHRVEDGSVVFNLNPEAGEGACVYSTRGRLVGVLNRVGNALYAPDRDLQAGTYVIRPGSQSAESSHRFVILGR
jgi:hypothetical protein